MTSLWMDRFGSVASAACAAHCLLLSVAPALLSLLGLELLANEAFEWGFFSLALALAVPAGALGFRIHRNRWVLGAFGVGVLVLVAGRLGEALALFQGAGMLAILGGFVLVGSHLTSIRHVQACREEDSARPGPPASVWSARS